jgi:hypothetical protein
VLIGAQQPSPPTPMTVSIQRLLFFNENTLMKMSTPKDGKGEIYTKQYEETPYKIEAMY